MSDLRYAKPGDKPIRSASAFNAMLDAARAHLRTNNVDPNKPRLVNDPSVIHVHNTTGEDLDYLAIAGLEEPVFNPFDEDVSDALNAAAEDTLLNETTFTISWPPNNSHRGRFVVLLEPIPDDGVGSARVCDTQLVTVEDTVLVGQFVDVKQDARPSENILSRVPGGSAKVLWTGPKRNSITIGVTTAGSGSTNEVQSITLGNYDGGTFTLTFDDAISPATPNPQTTTALDFDASNAEIKAALEALSNLNLVTVTGGPLPLVPVAVEFQGTAALADLNLMTAESSLTGAPNWALVRMCSDEAEIIPGIVVDEITAAENPLTGATCFTVRPIEDSGAVGQSNFISVPDAGSPTGFAWYLASSTCLTDPSIAEVLAIFVASFPQTPAVSDAAGYPVDADQVYEPACEEGCANVFDTVANRINRQRVTDSLDPLPDEDFDIDAVNRSADATADLGTFCKIDSAGGEFGWCVLDCTATDLGIAVAEGVDSVYTLFMSAGASLASFAAAYGGGAFLGLIGIPSSSGSSFALAAAYGD